MARVHLVIGLGFGDEGKGATVARLTRELGARLVVRFNGGAQAGHNVVMPDGRHHCFAQWGSGTFSGARTLLSRFMMVNPVFAMAEARRLEASGVALPLGLLTIEEEALVTTPFHVAANRIKELSRGDKLHGSCGMGVGETREDVLRGYAPINARDLVEPGLLRMKLVAQQERKLLEVRGLVSGGHPAAAAEMAVLEDRSLVEDIVRLYAAFGSRVEVVGRGWLREELAKHEHVVFEGAQGVLLDEEYGFAPHNTWSDCTFGNAHHLLKLSLHRVEFVRRIGVLRVFHTRHGAGPFPTETWAPAMRELVANDHNAKGPWQGDFRVGAFDAPLARYALGAVGGCDHLFFTHVDRLVGRENVATCIAYESAGWRKDLGSARPVYRFSSAKTEALASRYTGDLAEDLGVDSTGVWGPT